MYKVTHYIEYEHETYNNNVFFFTILRRNERVNRIVVRFRTTIISSISFIELFMTLNK